MRIMAINTAQGALHLALQTEAGYCSTVSTLEEHVSEKLVPRMRNLCGEAGITLAELSLLVCAHGPGSFTGLRVGMAAAKGVSLAAHIPLVSLSTMEIYQYPFAFCSTPVLPALDAKKRRFYCALFKHGVRLSEDLDATPSQVYDMLSIFDTVLITGPNGSDLAEKLREDPSYRSLADRMIVDYLFYRDYGESMIRLGIERYKTHGADTSMQGPVYIRKSDAQLVREEEDYKRESKT